MKKFLALILFFSITLVACNKQGESKSGATTASGKHADLMDQFFYVYGFNLGNKFKQDSLKINYDIFLAGLKEGFSADSSKLYSKAEIDSIFMKFNEQMMLKQEALKVSEAEVSKKFIEENKNKPGVKVTSTGLQYIVHKEGEGKSPKDEDFIKFKISGSLANGKKLDGGMKDAPPQEVPLKAVNSLPGLYEALKMMKPGAHYTVFLPPALGYGDRGMPERGIAGNSTVIFEIEFLGYGKAPEPGQMMPGQQGQPQMQVRPN